MGSSLQKAGASPREVIEEAEQIFFEAMLSGYAEFKRGLWRVSDTWIVGTYGNSAGWTTMFWRERPFWNMQYQGCYRDEAIPFLKRALLENYRKRIFLGGRGPTKFEIREGFVALRYENTPTRSLRLSGGMASGFDQFYGEERITQLQHDVSDCGTTTRVLGLGRYQGMRLFQFDE